MDARVQKHRMTRWLGWLFVVLFLMTSWGAQATVEAVAPLSGGTTWWWQGAIGPYPSADAACLAGTYAPRTNYWLWWSTGNFSYAGAVPSVHGYASAGYLDCAFIYTPTGQIIYSATAVPVINAVCPVPTVNPTVPYQYKAATGMCEREAPVAACSVTALAPLDPALQPYEDGLVDMENETQATRDGVACIVRSARAHRPRVNATIVSGYRPQAYQTHIREVYDKWQLLENNNDAECADIKNQIKTEFDHHSPFAHQPGNTSRHSTRRAVDISLTNYADADAIAAGCVVAGGGAMSRPVANDRSHFESPR